MRLPLFANMVFLQLKKSISMTASSANIGAQIHHISDELPNHALNCAPPRIKLTARKSTHFLRRRGPSFPGNLTNEQSSNGSHLPNYTLNVISDSAAVSPLSLPSDGLLFESLEEVLGNIPPDISDPPKLSAFDDIGETLSYRLNPVLRGENTTPRLKPAVAKQTARKSFPRVYASPRELNTSADYLLKSLENCLIANKCLTDSRFRLSNSNCIGSDACVYYQTRLTFRVDSSIEHRLPTKPEILCLRDCLRSMPENLADLRSTPIVIIDGSIKKLLTDERYNNVSIEIVLTNEDSVIYTGPGRFTLAKNCTVVNTYCDLRQISPARITSDGLGSTMTKPPTLSPKVLAYPPPPILLSELPCIIDEEDNGNIEMPPLLLPTGACKEPCDRESSKSPEMPILSPVDGENLGHEPDIREVSLQPEVVSKTSTEGDSFNFRARYKTQRKKGLALSFKRQCPVRTARTDAYFQGRYAFLAGKKVRDPNWKKNMNGSKSPEKISTRPRLMKIMRPRRWRRGGRRPRLRRNIFGSNLMQHNPHVDIIDGLEFLSFETEVDLKRFMKCHPSVTLDVSKLSDKELEKFSLLPETKESVLDAINTVTLTSGQRIRGEPIVLTKTNDFTKIKGWRDKLFVCVPDKKGKDSEKRVSLARTCKTMAEVKISSAAHNFRSLGLMTGKEKGPTEQSHQITAVQVSGVSPPKLRSTGNENALFEIADKASDPKNTKSAFVSDFLDEFLRTNSELKISAAATLANDAKLKDSSEIKTKVVWPASDNYQVPPASPPMNNKYPFCLAPRTRAKPNFRRPFPIAKVPSQPVQRKVEVKRKVVKQIPSTITMETPAYLRCATDASGNPLPTCGRLEPVLMSATDAQFACMALVSRSLLLNPADSLPPLEEIGRMCKRVKDSPETLRMREKMCRQISIVIDRRHADRALSTLRTTYERELGGQIEPALDVSTKAFHELSAEEKWERMMSSTLENPCAKVEEEVVKKVPTSVSDDACREPHCQLGCICSSLKSARKKRKHCGRAQCMISCNCSSMDEQQTRKEDAEEKPTEVVTKRRREIRLPARLKDSVCDWSRAWLKASEPDEEFSLVPRKKRGKYKKSPKITCSETVIWHDPRKDAVTGVKNARIALKRPSAKVSDSFVEPPAKLKSTTEESVPRIIPDKRAVETARKSIAAANARKGGKLQGPMLSGRPENSPAAIRFPLPPLEKQESADLYHLPTASPMSVMPNPPSKKTFGNQHQKVLPMRRLLYNPDGSVAGVLVPAESQQCSTVPTRTARKSVSAPLPWVSNQRKALDQLNMAKVALQTKKSSVEDIVNDVVRDLVRKVSLTEELENAMKRFGNSSDAWISLSKPTPTPQEILHPHQRRDEMGNKVADGRNENPANPDIERRRCIREGIRQLYLLLVPMGANPYRRNYIKNIQYDILNMARTSIKQLRKDERALIRTKGKLNRKRTQLFEGYTQLLRGTSMDAKKQKETIHKLADKIQCCCTYRSKGKKTSELSTVEPLNFLAATSMRSYSKGGKCAPKSHNNKLDDDWLNVANLPSDSSTTGSSGSDTDTGALPNSRGETKVALLETARDQLKQLKKCLSTKFGQKSPQQNTSPVNGISKAIAAERPPSVSLPPVKPHMTTVRLKPPGNSPSWIPLHESTQSTQSGNRSSAEMHKVKTSTKIYPGGANSPTAAQPNLVSNKPTQSHSAPVQCWPLTAFERPRFQASILQRAKVTKKDVPPKSSGSNDVSSSSSIAVSNSRWLTNILPKPSPTANAMSKSCIGGSTPTVPLGSSSTSSFSGIKQNAVVSGNSSVVINDKSCAVVNSSTAAVFHGIHSTPSNVSGSSIPVLANVLAGSNKVLIPRIQRASPLASANTVAAKTYSSSTSLMGPNGKPIPFFRSVSTASLPTGPPGSLASLTGPIMPKGTTLFIGVMPTTTSCTQALTGMNVSLTNSVSKFPGASDKMTPIMAISLPSSATSITLDGKKLCFLKPGRLPTNVVTSVTMDETATDVSLTAKTTGSVLHTDGAGYTVPIVEDGSATSEKRDAALTSAVGTSETTVATSSVNLGSAVQTENATIVTSVTTALASTTTTCVTAALSASEKASTEASKCTSDAVPTEGTSADLAVANATTTTVAVAPLETAEAILNEETVAQADGASESSPPSLGLLIDSVEEDGKISEESVVAASPKGNPSVACSEDLLIENTDLDADLGISITIPEEISALEKSDADFPSLLDDLEIMPVIESIESLASSLDITITSDAPAGCAADSNVGCSTSIMTDDAPTECADLTVIEGFGDLNVAEEAFLECAEGAGVGVEIVNVSGEAPAECAEAAAPLEEDWPKIVAFSSISEDEFLCEEVEVGKQDGPSEDEVPLC